MELPGQLSEKIVSQAPDVLPALAQRGNIHRKSREAEKEVGAEAPALDGFAQAHIRGRDDARIHGNGLCAAEPLERLFFDQPEEFRLRGQWQFANLIEK